MKPTLLPGALNVINKNAIDWGYHDFLVYGCQNLVVILDCYSKKVIKTLDQHDDMVSHIRLKPHHQNNSYNITNDNSSYVATCLSCDIKSNIILWDILSGTCINIMTNPDQDKAKEFIIQDIQWVPNKYMCSLEYIITLKNFNAHGHSNLTILNAFSGVIVWRHKLSECAKFIAYDPFDYKRFIVSGPGYVELYRDCDPQDFCKSAHINSKFLHKTPKKFYLLSYQTGKKIATESKQSANYIAESFIPYTNVINLAKSPDKETYSQSKFSSFIRKGVKTLFTHPVDESQDDTEIRSGTNPPGKEFLLNSPKDHSQISNDIFKQFLDKDINDPLYNETIFKQHNTSKDNSECLQLVWSLCWPNLFYLVYPREIVALVLEKDGSFLYNPCRRGSLIKTQNEETFFKICLNQTRTEGFADYGEAFYTVTSSATVQLRFQAQFHGVMKAITTLKLEEGGSDLSQLYDTINNYDVPSASNILAKESSPPISTQSHPLSSSFSSFKNMGTSSRLFCGQKKGSFYPTSTIMGACASPLTGNSVAILISCSEKGATSSIGDNASYGSSMLYFWQMETKNHNAISSKGIGNVAVKIVEQPNIFAPLATEGEGCEQNVQVSDVCRHDSCTSQNLGEILEACLAPSPTLIAPPKNQQAIKFTLSSTVSALPCCPTIMSIRPKIFQDFKQGSNEFNGCTLAAIGTTTGSIHIVDLNGAKRGLLRNFNGLHDNPIKHLYWIGPLSVISYSISTEFSKSTGTKGQYKNDISYLDIQTGFTYQVRGGRMDKSAFRIFKVSSKGLYLIITFHDSKHQTPELWNLRSFTLIRRFPKNFPKIVNLAWNVCPFENGDEKDGSEIESFVFSDPKNQTFYFSIRGNVVNKGIKLPRVLIPGCEDLGYASLAFHHPSTALLMAGRDGTIIISKEPLQKSLQTGSNKTMVSAITSAPTLVSIKLAEIELSKPETNGGVGMAREKLHKILFSPARDNRSGSTLVIPKVLISTNLRLEVWDIQEGIRLFHCFHSSADPAWRPIKIKDVSWLTSDYIAYITTTGQLGIADYSLRTFWKKEKMIDKSIITNPDHSSQDLLPFLGHNYNDSNDKTHQYPLYEQDVGIRKPSVCCLSKSFSTFATWLICNFRHDNGVLASPSSLPTPPASVDAQKLGQVILSNVISQMRQLNVWGSAESPLSTIQKCVIASEWFGCDRLETEYWRYAFDCLLNARSGIKKAVTEGDESCPISFRRLMRGQYLQENDLFKKFELVKLMLRRQSNVDPNNETFDSPKFATDAECKNNFEENISPLDEFKMLGLNREVVRWLVDREKSSFEAAFFASAPSADQNSHATVKLVATNLIALGNLRGNMIATGSHFFPFNAYVDGIAMLCCICKFFDACQYLQSAGYWERAAWIAKVTLRQEAYLQIMERWANYLCSSDQGFNIFASMIYLGIGMYEKACRALLNAQRGDMAFFLYKGILEFELIVEQDSKTDSLITDTSPLSAQKGRLWREVCESYVNHLLQTENKAAVASYFHLAATSSR